ncbi:MAG: tRNA (adenosine(37)-N6)-threonylcarbamoyltransferase complex dimerization subunit type 1 TsaB [Betaproteobacteria bacterium]|nr:tRNA (adenosine(37)-N6)-threonylcarbamoyltransferase complex dimerization subunit type 1 TsaB [Betaproteobacteria bacterium]
MPLLALETSTENLSLAIWQDGRIWSRDIDAGQRHAELTMPALHALLAEAGIDLSMVTAVAFGQGPGSFTGVRIACGLAQGLALGLGCRVVAIPTLLALAEATSVQRVLVAQDARMGEYYLAAYERDAQEASGWRALIPPMLATPAHLPELPGEGWAATGSALAVTELASALQSCYGAQLNTASPGQRPSAREVAVLAARQIASQHDACLLPPEEAAPLYLRNKVAMTIEERSAHHAAKGAL